MLMKDERVAASDLVPGAYEGGFKLWECSLDLCRYLLTEYKADPALVLSAPELACGLRVGAVGKGGGCCSTALRCCYQGACMPDREREHGRPAPGCQVTCGKFVRQ